MKKVKITLDNIEYNMVLNLRSALEFEKLHKKPLLVGIEDITTKNDITAIVHLLCATCRDSKGKIISKDVVLGLDLIQTLPIIMEAFTKLLVREEEGIEG